jgi:hypothetical protein
VIQIGLHGGGRMLVRDDGTVDVSAVTPRVLAFGLSNVTRFGGQAGPYSDAEHSVRMYDWAKAEGQSVPVLRAILLHDAAECLGEGDTQRFVKRLFGGEGLKKFARTVTAALWVMYCPARFDATVWGWDEALSPHVKEYDGWIGSIEARAFGFPHEAIPDWLAVPAFAVPDPENLWTPFESRRQYLARWEESC